MMSWQVDQVEAGTTCEVRNLSGCKSWRSTCLDRSFSDQEDGEIDFDDFLEFNYEEDFVGKAPKHLAFDFALPLKSKTKSDDGITYIDPLLTSLSSNIAALEASDENSNLSKQSSMSDSLVSEDSGFESIGENLSPNPDKEGKHFDYEIPTAEATVENFGFYGCKILSSGKKIRLSQKSLVAHCDIKSGFGCQTDKTRNQKFSNQLYLEKRSTTSVYVPLNPGNDQGSILLCREDPTSVCRYQLSFMKIPQKNFLVVPAGVWHSDSFLLGQFKVVVGLHNSSEIRKVIDRKSGLGPRVFVA